MTLRAVCLSPDGSDDVAYSFYLLSTVQYGLVRVPLIIQPFIYTPSPSSMYIAPVQCRSLGVRSFTSHMVFKHWPLIYAHDAYLYFSMGSTEWLNGDRPATTPYARQLLAHVGH